MLKKSFFKIIVFLFLTNIIFGQNTDFNSFLNDATLYSDKFITPITDAAVYQSSSAWVNSAKKRKLWKTTLGIKSNIFFIPNSDRSFKLSNNDLSFLRIENKNEIDAATSIGGEETNYLVGNLELSPGSGSFIPIRIAAPNGINQSTIIYNYAQVEVSVWKGFEILAKYSAKNKLKRGNYQVYGLGLKHNISQYFKSLEKRKINISVATTFSKEEVESQFLNVPLLASGSIGIDKIFSKVNTKQFQVNVSKEYKNWEILAGLIVNNSNFKYEFSGDENPNISGLKELLNNKIQEIAKNKTNFLAEVSGRYNWKKFYFQPTLAFGKFINTNFSVQYEF